MRKSELILRRLWLTILRSGRDARARKIVLRIGFIVLYYAAYAMYARKEAQEIGPWGFVFSIVLLVLASGVVYFIRRGHAKEDASLLTLSARVSAAPPSDLSNHRRQIASALLHLPAMVDRAGTEALHQQSKMAPGNIGAGRRRSLDVAMRPDVWLNVPVADRDLLRSAEGSWTWDEVWPWIVRAEDVRVLRWVLGIDEVLTPFEFLRPDLTVAIELTLKPERADGTTCLASYDLRPEQTMAQTMVTRCVGEGIHRGQLDEPDEAAREELVAMAQSLGSSEDADLLAGTEIVGKASWDRISWVGQAALRRLKVLTALIDYLNGPPTQSASLRNV